MGARNRSSARVVRAPGRRFRLLLVLLLSVSFILNGWDRLPMGVRPARADFSWYVSTTGDDANGCTGPATPCRTIGAALRAAASGDTIQVAGGTYAENLVIQGLDPITIIGAAGGTVI